MPRLHCKGFPSSSECLLSSSWSRGLLPPQTLHLTVHRPPEHLIVQRIWPSRTQADHPSALRPVSYARGRWLSKLVTAVHARTWDLRMQHLHAVNHQGRMAALVKTAPDLSHESCVVMTLFGLACLCLWPGLCRCELCPGCEFRV